ncbi:MAG: prepilin-type N-terminal cleavage/methylation domain-containing protein [Patescibacteria group bacterium]|nr:prepilin-type N-terminal cleavage/methylation domain-containing protein [Patescibacteria group bacterium]
MPCRQQSGFSLIELLVIIAIVAAIAVFCVVSVDDARRQSRDLKRVADVRQLQMSLELFNDDHNGYPTEVSPVVLGDGNFRALCAGGFKAACSPGELVGQGIVPRAPQPVDGNCTHEANEYLYQTPGGKTEFRITFCLGKRTGELAPGLHIATPSGIK